MQPSYPYRTWDRWRRWELNPIPKPRRDGRCAFRGAVHRLENHSAQDAKPLGAVAAALSGPR